MRKEAMYLNNIRMRIKFVLLFIVCVVIPLISTNGFLVSSMISAAEADERRELENLADRAEYDISSRIDNIISIADYFYTDMRIYEFLGKKYDSPTSYYDAYLKLMDSNVIQNFYSAESVHNVLICTKNQTITNGTYFVRKEAVENSSWYQAFLDSGRQRLFYVFYEDGKNSAGYLEQGRHIILIQKMDYFGGSDIMFLDVDYRKLFENIRMEEREVTIYDGEKTLFSTKEALGEKNEFTEAPSFKKSEISFEKVIQNYGAKWTIHLFGSNYTIHHLIKDNIVGLVILYFINLLLPAFLFWLIYQSFQKRIYLLNENMLQVQQGEYEEISNHTAPSDSNLSSPKEAPVGGKDELGNMIQTYNLMVRKIKELIEVDFKNKEKQQNLEISKKQAELAALQSQINPHFMFNALESIRMHSILKNETETAKILESFSVLMRKNIQWNKDFVTIQEEIDNVSRYLQIQKYRFGDRLTFSVHVQEECAQQEIPKFIIITFVENACVHGIEDSLDGGDVTVVVSSDEEYLYFEVMDSGSGMTEEELLALQEKVEHADITDIQNAKKSIGILNSVVRMRQYYGENVVIDVNSTKDEGTEICVRLPKELKKD